jgi:hypothetical protein
MAVRTIDQDATRREKERTMTRTHRVCAALAGACAAVLAVLVLAAPAHADWGIKPGTLEVDVSTNQAGGHPDVTTRFELETEPDASPIGVRPVENPKDIRVELPPGLVGNPEAYPKCRPSAFPECPTDTQVGVAKLWTALFAEIHAPIFNMEPAQGKVAQFAFSALLPVVQISADLRSDGDYGLTMEIPNTPTIAPLLATELKFWGTPASPANDTERMKMCFDMGPAAPPGQEGLQCAGPDGPYPAAGIPSGAVERAFMTNPTRCDGPGEIRVTMNSWESPDDHRTYKVATPAMTGCEKVRFEPQLTVRSGSREAGAPTGLAVDIDIPQYDRPDLLGTAPLNRAVVRLPEGMTLSPSAADGLVGCTNAQVGLGSKAPANCPKASEIGTASIKSPLMAEPMTGRIYLGTPTPQQLVRIFLVVQGGGVRLKLPGAIDADPSTGRLTTTFADQPMLPASKISLRFADGPWAVLSNPIGCNTFTAEADLTPWSGGAPVRRTSRFTVDQGCERPAAFTPSVTGGVTNPIAGASSPFTFTLTKPDGQPNVRSLDLTLPQGLLARLADVPLCPEAQAVSGSCSPASQVGHASVAVGPGTHPVRLPQAGRAGTAVYLAGPYAQAPFSLVIKVPAQAGPYDLGVVVVRAALHVDAAKAQVTVQSDPLPQILRGFPLQYRSITIAIDRPGFMLNPTSCAEQSLGAVITSAAGQHAPAAARFQVGECAAIPLSPRLDLQLTGKGQTRDGSHPGLDAELTQQPGESGLGKVEVALPLSVALDPDNARALCTPEQAQARACPDASIVGQARVQTPALHEPLTGPVYFVEGRRTTASGQTRRTLPRLWLKLSGQGVPLDLWASSDVDDQQRLVTTFDDIPDAPITRFTLMIYGGKNGILAGTRDICAENNRSDVVFTGQTGKVTEQRVRVGVADCAPRVARTTTSARAVSLRLSGLSAGTLTLSGDRIATTRRTIKRANAATITGRLTRAARRTLARTGRVRVRVVATFRPNAGGKTTRITRTVTIRARRS